MSEKQYFYLDNISFLWPAGRFTDHNKVLYNNTMIIINIYYYFWILYEQLQSNKATSLKNYSIL